MKSVEKKVNIKEKIINIIKNEKLVFLFLIIIAVINWLWFFPFSDRGFLMGDDIKLYNFFTYDASFENIFLNGTTTYRPIFHPIICILVKQFGIIYNSYLSFNIIFNIIIAYSIYYISYRLSNKKKSFAFLISILYTIYSYYGVTQLFGLMELMCVLFCSWIFYYLYKFLDSKNDKYYYISVIFYFLALNTHERFLAIWGIYLIFNLFILFKDKWKVRIKRLLVASIPTVLYIIMKTIIFKAKLFVGTGQRDVSFDFYQFYLNIKQTILSIFGINTGPNFLSGFTFDRFEFVIQFLIIVSSICIITIILYYLITSIIKKDSKKIQMFLLFFFFEGATIICYAISSRVEMRNIYVPYVILLLFCAYCFNNINLNKDFIKTNVILWIICSSISGYIYYLNVGEVFFVQSMKEARSSFAALNNITRDFAGYDLYIEDNPELKWSLLTKWTEIEGDYDNVIDMFFVKGTEYEYFDFTDYSSLKRMINNSKKEGKNSIVLFLNARHEGVAVVFTDEVNNKQLQDILVRE